MSKKVNITGFRHAYIDDEVDGIASQARNDGDDEEKTPSMEEELVALIFDRYAPVDSLPESTEQKTTMDLVDEMESSSEVSKNKVVMALKECGFKLHYTGGEYVWMLKERLDSLPPAPPKEG
jgi:hypothetical protein